VKREAIAKLTNVLTRGTSGRNGINMSGNEVLYDSDPELMQWHDLYLSEQDHFEHTVPSDIRESFFKLDI
jgi:hypothetical protein